MKYLCPLALALVVAAAPHAHAGSVTGSVTITIQQLLKLVFTPAAPTVLCNAPAGTVVAALSTTGGDGNAVTYTATGGDTADFAVNGTNVVVGPNGIAAANCPPAGQTTTENVTIQATQP
jgi:hypothetical protein